MKRQRIRENSKVTPRSCQRGRHALFHKVREADDIDQASDINAARRAAIGNSASNEIRYDILRQKPGISQGVPGGMVRNMLTSW